jgi:hypothetical protein
MLAELRRLRTKFSAGSSSVVNPRVGGSHGDIAQALSLAVWEHDRHGLAGGELRPRREAREDDRALTAGLVDLGPRFRRRDRTRQAPWYDGAGETLDRAF